MPVSDDKDGPLSYEELYRQYKQLQDRVTQGVVLQQKLFSIRDELDQELERYRIIQEFNKRALACELLDEFAVLTTEYFVQAFEQAHCLFAEYLPAYDQFRVLACFGFPDNKLPTRFSLPSEVLRGNEAAFLSKQTGISEALGFLQLAEALVAPLIGPDQELKGLIVCGQQPEDLRFYSSISNKAKPSFMVMSINAAYLLHQFQATEQLRNEIEERRRVENMLEDQAVELRRSNQELEQFAYVVSHDLKAPLHNLKGFAKLLFEKELGRLSNAGKEYLQIIQEEVNRFEQTIDGLLRYARLSSGPQESMKQVHFDEVLNRVKSQIVLILQEKSGLIQSGPLPTLKANQLQMEQLFLNLLTNALKFTPDGRAPEIGITAQKIDGAYLFCVKDNGIGLPPETGHSIFRLFKQLKSGEKKEGQGIGLSICQKIVNQHGGKIWAESEGIGKGTSFYFTLATG